VIAAAFNEKAEDEKIKRSIKMMKVPIAEMWGDKQQSRKATETIQWLAASAKTEERLSGILSYAAWLTIH
jgi:hypothetical protein